MKQIATIIRDEITAIGNPEKARWLENYVKHDVRSKGVGIPEIRQIVKRINNERGISAKPVSQQMDLLTALMQQDYAEDKLAAILYLQLFWNNQHENQKLILISQWFDQGFIADWNVCDWLCVRILSPMVDAHPDTIIIELSKWNKSPYLWKARASLVAFARAKQIIRHKDVIRLFSGELIKRDERFCKTAVGWVLREISRSNPFFVTDFLKEYVNWTSNEVIKNATKYIK